MTHLHPRVRELSRMKEYNRKIARAPSHPAGTNEIAGIRAGGERRKILALSHGAGCER